MNIIRKEHKFCPSCMTEHDVDIIEIVDHNMFKGELVEFSARFEHCAKTDEAFAPEALIESNDLVMKDAYRRQVGLLTSQEIIKIREKYGVSQKDFSTILDWGAATITRYENHQVQDRAHDDILRKLASDPQWMIQMIERAQPCLSTKAFQMYYSKAQSLYNALWNDYLTHAIQAQYARFNDSELTGGVSLNLEKAIELINYLAQKVNHLHKVKLMKLLWYADSLHFKRTGKAITGFVYRALPMGAVPVDSEQLLALNGICFDEINYGEYEGFKFRASPDFQIRALQTDEITSIDCIIKTLGHMNKNRIVSKMHMEKAFQKTPPMEPISFVFAKDLSID